jgi:hypothetical protein
MQAERRKHQGPLPLAKQLHKVHKARRQLLLASWQGLRYRADSLWPLVDGQGRVHKVEVRLRLGINVQ